MLDDDPVVQLQRMIDVVEAHGDVDLPHRVPRPSHTQRLPGSALACRAHSDLGRHHVLDDVPHGLVEVISWRSRRPGSAPRTTSPSSVAVDGSRPCNSAHPTGGGSNAIRVSTNRVAASSSSRGSSPLGGLYPTELTWVPARIHSGRTMGSPACDDSATTSLPRTAASKSSTARARGCVAAVARRPPGTASRCGSPRSRGQRERSQVMLALHPRPHNGQHAREQPRRHRGRRRGSNRRDVGPIDERAAGSRRRIEQADDSQVRRQTGVLAQVVLEHRHHLDGHVAAVPMPRHPEQERLVGHADLVALRRIHRSGAELPEADFELHEKRLEVDQVLDLALVQEQEVHSE